MAGTEEAMSRQIAARPAIRAWLFAVAGLVFCMVLVGGATRLTDSGLSITEWQPILGAIPPLSEADWQLAFDKYRQIPEYRIVNRGMSLEAFKTIYWWEWAHRFLGRFIGVAFFVPMLVFWLTGRLEAKLKPKLVALFLLGAAQGVLGWYMVMSGLVERTDVSQYRLAAHLTLASVIFAALIWVALRIGEPGPQRMPPAIWTPALAILAALVLQIAAGGFVAGLDAGLASDTWPLMHGHLVPEGLGVMSPAWRNLFENALTVQFQHRLLAYLLLAAIAAYAFAARRTFRPGALVTSAVALFAATLAQAVIGIATVVLQVPLPLALLHQAGAMIVLALAVLHLHLLASEPASRRSTGHDAPLMPSAPGRDRR